jgi:hypothetical protein
VVEVAEQQRVGDEAGLVADDDRLLVQALGEGLDVLEDVVVGDDGADDLDELHHGRGVEEVHADDTRLGCLRGDRELGDRQRRGVRREDRVIGDDGVDRREELLLQRQLLGDGLDDELAVGQVLQVGRVGDPALADSRRSSAVILPRATARSMELARTPLPRSSAVPSTSTATTSMPARAKISAMPAPMTPSPMTPTVLNSRAIPAVSQRGVQTLYAAGSDGGHTRRPGLRPT